MSLFLFKSILSLFMILAAIIAMFTMFEIFGSSTKRYDVTKLKVIHRVNGIIYLIVFSFIAYFCLHFIIATKVELSSRATFHSIFALTIIILFCVKIAFIRIYKEFYGQARTLGLLIALVTFGMVGTSGIYYLLVSEFGKDKNLDMVMKSKMKGPDEIVLVKNEDSTMVVKTSPEDIDKGKKLFEESCSFCHDPYSTKIMVGPGLMGILKNPTLPVSKKQATPENISEQLMNPYKRMPSFSHLQEKDVLNIIAFLNTL